MRGSVVSQRYPFLFLLLSDSRFHPGKRAAGKTQAAPTKSVSRLSTSACGCKQYPYQHSAAQTNREGQTHHHQHGIDTAQPVDPPAQQRRTDDDGDTLNPCPQELSARLTRSRMSE